MFIGVLAVIFALNCTTLVRALKQTAEARNLELPIKKNFNINKNLSSPNIYWIHADGMLSFNAVAKYFNDNQEKFLNELEQRGFEINKGA
ncbi:MAG: hypothetical protein IJQ63_07985, partial [Synergistaceae bacterium]|nr:hypothetical protein [Synergistaceae bacterium]